MSLASQMSGESSPLLPRETTSKLSLLFATLCIVDIFGVLPVIALARPLALCGWYSIPIVICVLVFQIYTSALLGKSWNIISTIHPSIHQKNRYPLAAVTEFTLGRKASILVTILLDLTIFGGGVPVLLVASQNLQIFGFKISDSQANWSFCYWLLVVGMILCPLMWLGSPRDMKWLVLFSMGACTLTAILICYAVANDERRIPDLPLPARPTWDSFVSAYGVLSYQFDVHPTLLTVQVDMKKPRDVCKAVILAYAIYVIMFTVTTSLAAVTAYTVITKYGANITANVLEIAPSSKAIHAAILIAAIQLCASTVLGHSALFQHLEDSLHINRSFCWKRCAMRTSVVCLAVAVGESVPRFDVIMALIGGTVTGPLVFILPPLLYSKARKLRHLGPMYPSTPELKFSGPDRDKLQRWNEVFSDPKVHSRSTHYGFRTGAEAGDDGYSFTYYNSGKGEKGDNGKELSGINKHEHEGLESPRRSGSLPVMIDATMPSVNLRRREIFTRATSMDAAEGCTDGCSDLIGYFVAIVGIILTIASTYTNLLTTIRYVEFTPPCIINASIPPVSFL